MLMIILKFFAVLVNLYLLFCLIAPKKGFFFIADEEKRKRRFVILGYVLFFMFFSAIYSKMGNEDKSPELEKMEAPKATIGTPEWYAAQIDSARTDSVKLTNFKTDTLDIESMELSEINLFAKICKFHYANPTKEVFENEHLTSLYSHNRKQCTRIFNSCCIRLRKQYANVLNKIMWEDNVEVKVSGKKADVLWLTGGWLAANKNKKKVQETIAESVRLLEFKRVCYKWYKYDDEYTYWDIEQ